MRLRSGRGAGGLQPLAQPGNHRLGRAGRNALPRNAERAERRTEPAERLQRLSEATVHRSDGPAADVGAGVPVHRPDGGRAGSLHDSGCALHAGHPRGGGGGAPGPASGGFGANSVGRAVSLGLWADSVRPAAEAALYQPDVELSGAVPVRRRAGHEHDSADSSGKPHGGRGPIRAGRPDGRL